LQPKQVEENLVSFEFYTDALFFNFPSDHG